MAMSLEAASPHVSATVTASAGSGKTWLLVARMVRLLLHGAEPGSILALTFTRKAAAEMQARLTDRLRELALADDQILTGLLEELGEQANDQLMQQARALYEKCLFTDYPVRAMTFHSFCQDILARFPVEANLPPGFELVDNTTLLIEQSLQQLYNEATLAPDDELAQNLETLLEHCQSIDSTKTALKSFIDKRSDWWAYTEGETEPVKFATQALKSILKIDDTDPLASLFTRSLPGKLERFREIHIEIATAKQMPQAEIITSALNDTPVTLATFSQVYEVFFTQKNTVRSRTVSQANRKKIGDDTAEEYIQLHNEIAEQLFDVRDLLLRQKTFERNSAWFYAGQHLLKLFQRLKSQLLSLDFTDLEWRTYQLLKHSDNAEWVQYKLDQRIDHLLVDEFQDTNPTQWYLLKPLLEELAAGDPERQRTMFIVGDEKQSIYGFRRANPELQAHVADWLQQHIGAQQWPLNKSWRSSPAIIDLVNAVYINDEDRLLDHFPEHGTHRENLSGKIILRERFNAPDKEALPQPVYFRNPLVQARLSEKNRQYLAEAEWIAGKIDEIISQGLTVQRDDEQVPVQYDDIYILLRNRTHVAQIEEVLRQHQIPFISANRYTLLHTLEIQDMEALLEVLIAPYNDLAMARVLKSPIFSATDNDLLVLSRITESRRWFKKIEKFVANIDTNHPVARVHHYLQKWRKLADRIPVHDLIDIIFYDTNLLNRYRAAAPDAIKNQVTANLQSLLELALDIDSGRYPSITHFLNQLRTLKKLANEAPDEAPADSGKARVQILTVHAAKGLEAPVVFIADSDTQTKPKIAHHAMVDWPTNSARPEAFHLMGSKDNQDRISQQFIDKSEAFQQREDLNLLYVAMTRARQFLFVSASEPNRASQNRVPSWYQHIKNAMQKIATVTQHNDEIVYKVGEIGYQPDAALETAAPEIIDVPDALSEIIFEKETIEPVSPDAISPSEMEPLETATTDEDAKTRGTVIHRALELLSGETEISQSQILLQLKNESGNLLSEDQYLDCIDEARSVLSDSKLDFLFNASQFDRFYNELPIHYRAGKKEIHGVIDRVVMKDADLFLVDYKTHANITEDDIPSIAEQYRAQLQFYKNGLSQIWPTHSIKPLLLFTTTQTLFEMQE